MFEQLHDKMWILFQFSKVRPRLHLSGVLTNKFADDHPQVGELELLAKDEKVHGGVQLNVLHQGGLQALLHQLHLVEISGGEKLHDLGRVDVEDVHLSTVHETKEDLHGSTVNISDQHGRGLQGHHVHHHMAFWSHDGSMNLDIDHE